MTYVPYLVTLAYVMQVPTNTYTLLDCGNELKLEQVGPYRLIRSAPQAIWSPELPDEEWQNIDASLTCVRDGKVEWDVVNKKMPDEWQITVPAGFMCMKRSEFGHLGIFPEQMRYWKILHQLTKDYIASSGECNVLNLFAYTGGSTLACAKSGGSVTHVDASKPSVSWARKNAASSGLQDAPIRWIVDDATKFVQREVQRGNTYHGIILDPPTYGKGSKGKGGTTWKIETCLMPLLQNLQKILHKDFAFVHLSAHSPNYEPSTLEHLLKKIIPGTSGTFLTEYMDLKLKVVATYQVERHACIHGKAIIESDVTIVYM